MCDVYLWSIRYNYLLSKILHTYLILSSLLMRLNHLRYQDPDTKTYLSSPSITRLPDRNILATHDYFGSASPVNHEGMQHLTSVYRSKDHGTTWDNITHISGAFWSTLFVHLDKVYLLGTSQEWGSIVIRRSDNGGLTWTDPKDIATGLLFKAGSNQNIPNYHCGATPVLNAQGRLYKGFENLVTNDNGDATLEAFVISVSENDDLLDGSKWTMTNKLKLNSQSFPKSSEFQKDLTWREGNIVKAPNGEIWDILRVNPGNQVDKAAVIKVHHDYNHISFDLETGFIPFPGGATKFTIRRDEITDTYWTLSNGNINSSFPTRRSILSLYKSQDLLSWDHIAILLQDDTGLSSEDAVRLTGFQYVDWQFDGNDIIYLVRTAYDGAPNYHDSNRITFHEVRDFREISQ